jgi:hypothetical protein
MMAIFALMLSVNVGAAPSPAAIQAGKAETGTEFYLRFRKTALAAKSMGEVTPFWGGELLEQFNMEPDADKAATLDMLKRIEGTLTDFHVVNERATSGGATLELAAVGTDKKPLTGKVDLVKEKDAWKIVNVEWAPKS